MMNNIHYFRRTIVRQVLIFLYLVSGISASILVITWLRLIKLAFGVSFVTSSSVIISLLTGLSIGSYYFGTKIDQTRNELQLFMRFQLIMGSYQLLLLFLPTVLSPLYKATFPGPGESLLLMNIVTFAISFLLFLTPSVLIGASFPILSRFFIQSSHRVAKEIGNLYGVILAGAVLGCYLSGFAFVPIFGVKQTLVFAAMLSFFNFALVRFLLNKIESTIKIETEFYDQQLKHLATITHPGSRLLKRTLVIGISMAGFLFISYLLVWDKAFTFVLGDTVYSFHTFLIVFMAGISFGAILYPRLPEKGNPFSIFAIMQITIGVLAIFSIVFMPQLSSLNHGLSNLSYGFRSWGWQTLVGFYDALIIVFLPAVLMGMVIPMVCEVFLDNFEERGKKIGRFYSFHLFGAIAGFAITSSVLLPHVGMQKTISFLAFISLSLGLGFLFITTLRFGNILRTSVIFGAVAGIFLLSLFIPSNMMIKVIEKAVGGNPVVYIHEGLNTTATIHQDPSQNDLILASNGVVVSKTSKNWLNLQRVHAHLPLLLHEQPDTILTIGFRDGETLKSIFFHSVKYVDCADQNIEVAKASSFINGNRYQLLANPCLHVIPIDGEKFARVTKQKYDIIINDIVHPGFSGNCRLYSRDFFQACRNDLKPGGIMSSIVPMFDISIEDFKAIINTFREVFPTTTLWYTNNYLNQYGFLIGKIDTTFKINYSAIDARLKNSDILLDLSQIGLDNIYELLDSFIMGPKVVSQLTEGLRVISDNTPYLEFSTPKFAGNANKNQKNLQILANYREPVYPFLTNIDTTFEQREFVRLIMENYYQSTGLVFEALIGELSGNMEEALHIYRKVYMMNRFDRGAKRFIDAYYDTLLIPEPKTPSQLIQNATIYYQKMEYEEAINLANKALELNKDYAPAYFALGVNYEILRDYKKAKQMFKKTLKLKPNLKEAKSRLDSLSLKNGN